MRIDPEKVKVDVRRFEIISAIFEMPLEQLEWLQDFAEYLRGGKDPNTYNIRTNDSLEQERIILKNGKEVK